MADKRIKCPICGTMNKDGAESCEKCKTRLMRKGDGSLGVKSPKGRGKTHIMIDIEDPLTRKKLEELTLIPGVSRKKALLLYQSGIHSIEEFMEKAFHGERFSENYSRTVTNKLLVDSIQNKKKRKNTDIPCPSCNAPNPMTATNCKVCNFDIETNMKSVDMAEVSSRINDSVREVLDNLGKSEDFEQLPEDMKQQLALLVESDDIDFDMDKPKDVESLGMDIESLDAEGPEPEPEKANEPESDAAEERKEPAEKGPEEDTDKAPKPNEKKEKDTAKTGKKSTEKQDKIRAILTEKLAKWRKAGYDVEPLEQYLDDVDSFKKKAKEVLGAGKVVKLRYLKQVEMWREKGFNVSELESILESDVELFQEKAKELLKKQKK